MKKFYTLLTLLIVMVPYVPVAHSAAPSLVGPNSKSTWTPNKGESIEWARHDKRNTNVQFDLYRCDNIEHSASRPTRPKRPKRPKRLKRPSLISPNSKSKWTPNKKESIEWSQHDKGTTKVRLDFYSSDKKKHVAKILASTKNDGAHRWKIPQNVKSGKYRVRLMAFNGTYTNWSDAFTVKAIAVKASRPNIGSPNKKSKWTPNEKEPIKWGRHDRGKTKVQLDLYRSDKKKHVAKIKKTTSNDGDSFWKVPVDLSSGKYRVRIRTADKKYTNWSDAFSIKALPTTTYSGRPQLYLESGDFKLTATPRNTGEGPVHLTVYPRDGRRQVGVATDKNFKKKIDTIETNDRQIAFNPDDAAKKLRGGKGNIYLRTRVLLKGGKWSEWSKSFKVVYAPNPVKLAMQQREVKSNLKLVEARYVPYKVESLPSGCVAPEDATYKEKKWPLVKRYLLAHFEALDFFKTELASGLSGITGGVISEKIFEGAINIGLALAGVPPVVTDVYDLVQNGDPLQIARSLATSYVANLGAKQFTELAGDLFSEVPNTYGLKDDVIKKIEGKVHKELLFASEKAFDAVADAVEKDDNGRPLCKYIPRPWRLKLRIRNKGKNTETKILTIKDSSAMFRIEGPERDSYGQRISNRYTSVQVTVRPGETLAITVILNPHLKKGRASQMPEDDLERALDAWWRKLEKTRGKFEISWVNRVTEIRQNNWPAGVWKPKDVSVPGGSGVGPRFVYKSPKIDFKKKWKK